MAGPRHPRHYEESFKRQIVVALRERQALPGDQGRVRHLAFHAAPLGPGHPRQRLHPGRGQPHP